MKIFFLGDIDHPNTKNWINELKLQNCEIQIWSLPKIIHGKKISRIKGYLKGIFSIRKIIKKIDPDLLIAYRCSSYGFLGFLTGFHPFVVAQQGSTDIWPQHSWLTPIKRWMVRRSLKNADLIHAWADHMAKNQIENGADKNKILVMPKGTDTDKFKISHNQTPITSLHLIVTRSLFPVYNHELILNAIGDLKNLGIPIIVDIAGGGDLMDDLKKLVSELNIKENVNFLGRVNPENLPEIISRANVYVSMPDTEGASASLFEAMACGCFPIVSDILPNNILIQNNINGILVPIGDKNSLVNALLKIKDNSELFNLSRKLNREYVLKNASISHNVGEFINHYQRLVNK